MHSLSHERERGSVSQPPVLKRINRRLGNRRRRVAPPQGGRTLSRLAGHKAPTAARRLFPPLVITRPRGYARTT
jgi:hypothetical protein